MCRKVRTAVLFICDRLLRATDTSQCYYSDINLFLIDDAWCQLCNYGPSSARTTPSLHRSLTLEEKIIAVVTQDRLINDNFKRQIKNRTLCTCRLLLLTYIFQYTSSYSKIFQLLPTLFVHYTSLGIYFSW